MNSYFERAERILQNIMENSGIDPRGDAMTDANSFLYNVERGIEEIVESKLQAVAQARSRQNFGIAARPVTDGARAAADDHADLIREEEPEVLDPHPHDEGLERGEYFGERGEHEDC